MFEVTSVQQRSRLTTTLWNFLKSRLHNYAVRSASLYNLGLVPMRMSMHRSRLAANVYHVWLLFYRPATKRKTQPDAVISFKNVNHTFRNINSSIWLYGMCAIEWNQQYRYRDRVWSFCLCRYWLIFQAATTASLVYISNISSNIVHILITTADDEVACTRMICEDFYARCYTEDDDCMCVGSSVIQWNDCYCWW